MLEHYRLPTYDSQVGAVNRHNDLPGHSLDLENQTQVFHSDCKTTRCTVEAALIHVAPTVTRNTASARIDNNEMVAPVICRATRFIWKKLSDSIPSLSNKAIPQYHIHIFGTQEVVRSPPHLRSQPPPTPVSNRIRSHQPRETTDLT